jgi:hypothetical protein
MKQRKLKSVRSEGPTVVMLKSITLWDVTLCSMVQVY